MQHWISILLLCLIESQPQLGFSVKDFISCLGLSMSDGMQYLLYHISIGCGYNFFACCMPVVVLRHGLPKRFINCAFRQVSNNIVVHCLVPSSCSISSTNVAISEVTLAWSAIFFVMASIATSLTSLLQTCNAVGDGTSITYTTFNMEGGSRFRHHHRFRHGRR